MKRLPSLIIAIFLSFCLIANSSLAIAGEFVAQNTMHGEFISPTPASFFQAQAINAESAFANPMVRFEEIRHALSTAIRPHLTRDPNESELRSLIEHILAHPIEKFNADILMRVWKVEDFVNRAAPGNLVRALRPLFNRQTSAPPAEVKSPSAATTNTHNEYPPGYIELQLAFRAESEPERKLYRPAVTQVIKDVLGKILKPGMIVLELGSGHGELRDRAGDLPSSRNATWVESDIDARLNDRPNPYQTKRVLLALPDLGDLDSLIGKKPDVMVGLSMLHSNDQSYLEEYLAGIAHALPPEGLFIHFLDRPVDPCAEMVSVQDEELFIPYPIKRMGLQTAYGGLLIDKPLFLKKLKQHQIGNIKLSEMNSYINYIHSLLNGIDFNSNLLNPDLLEGFARALREMGVVKRDYPELTDRFDERLRTAAKAAKLEVVRSELVERSVLIPRSQYEGTLSRNNEVDARKPWIVSRLDEDLARDHPDMIRVRGAVHVFEAKRMRSTPKTNSKTVNTPAPGPVPIWEKSDPLIGLRDETVGAEAIRGVLEDVHFDENNFRLRDPSKGGDYDISPFPDFRAKVDHEAVMDVLRQGALMNSEGRRLYLAFRFFMYGGVLRAADLVQLFGEKHSAAIPGLLHSGLIRLSGPDRFATNGLSLATTKLENGKVLYVFVDTPPYLNFSEAFSARVYLGTDTWLFLKSLQKNRGFSGLGADLGAGSGALAFGVCESYPAVRQMILLEKDERARSMELFNASLNGLRHKILVARDRQEFEQALRTSGSNSVAFAVSNPPFHPVPLNLKVDLEWRSILPDYVTTRDGFAYLNLNALFFKAGWGGTDGMEIFRYFLDVFGNFAAELATVLAFSIQWPGMDEFPSHVRQMAENKGWTMNFEPSIESLNPRQTAEEAAQIVLNLVISSNPTLHPYRDALMRFAGNILRQYQELGITHFHAGVVSLTTAA